MSPPLAGLIVGLGFPLPSSLLTHQGMVFRRQTERAALFSLPLREETRDRPHIVLS